MKIFALLVSIVALISSAVALKHPVCGLQYAKDGNENFACMAHFPKWSYNSETKECGKFIYGGCGGNENSFNSRDECEAKCKE